MMKSYWGSPMLQFFSDCIWLPLSFFFTVEKRHTTWVLEAHGTAMHARMLEMKGRQFSMLPFIHQDLNCLRSYWQLRYLLTQLLVLPVQSATCTQVWPLTCGCRSLIVESMHPAKGKIYFGSFLVPHKRQGFILILVKWWHHRNYLAGPKPRQCPLPGHIGSIIRSRVQSRVQSIVQSPGFVVSLYSLLSQAR